MKIISLALVFSLLSLFVAISEMAKGENHQYAYKYVYRAGKGDTLWGISRRFKVPMDKIVRENSIKNPPCLMVGQKLFITKVFPAYFIGRASWYGGVFHGRTTANGETYNMFGVSAAHRTLPFDTVVLVENLRNGKVVKVRINDRGPYAEGRVLDLSFGAARKLGMVKKGVTPVLIKIIHLGG